MEKPKKQPNDIRVGFNSRIGSVVSYCENLLKEGTKTLNFSAVGGSIGTLVSVVEVLKTITPGLYQVNRFATITYQSVEEGNKNEAKNQRLYPKLEVILTLEKPDKVTEGFQDKLPEEERKKILECQQKLREQRKPRRGGFRGRRGGFRGRRGGFRGRRGGFRGRRGGFRGRRGGFRGRNGPAIKRGRGMNRGRGVFRGRGNRGAKKF